MSGVAWFSGGVASAVMCKLALSDDPSCDIVFLDTKNEHEDLYRFMDDCEKWLGKPIERLQDGRTPQDIWREQKWFVMLGVGAHCSNRLKRRVREKVQKERNWSYQCFGFDFCEIRRAKNLLMSNPEINPTFPLIEAKYDKYACFNTITRAGIELPYAYRVGFNNNNCLKSGCVQGGVGYWKHFKESFPAEFAETAKIEREVTKMAGRPATILRTAFLEPNPDYPNHKHLDQLRGRHIKPLEDCNGFCGLDDPMSNDMFGELLKSITNQPKEQT